MPISCKLPYIAPYDWTFVLSFFRAHQIPALETIDEHSYQRVIPTSAGLGCLHVTHESEHSQLRVSLSNGTQSDLAPLTSTVRSIFDLDADPHQIAAAMSADPSLARLWRHFPGLRVPRAWNGFESIVTTILGQLVSVVFGRTLIHQLLRAAGPEAQHPQTGEIIHLFPSPRQLLRADLSTVRTSPARRAALLSIASQIADATFPIDASLPPQQLRRLLRAVPGIGAWTAEYAAMRGFHDNDAFPATDYALKQELKRHPKLDVNRVRPWRAYAAAALWNAFLHRKSNPRASVL